MSTRRRAVAIGASALLGAAKLRLDAKHSFAPGTGGHPDKQQTSYPRAPKIALPTRM